MLTGRRRFGAALFSLLAAACSRTPAPPAGAPPPAPLALGPAVRDGLAELRARVKDEPAPEPSPETAARVGALTLRLDEPDPRIRRGIEDEIVAVGPGAIPALARVLADPGRPEHARGAAALALSRVDHPASVPPLVAALRDASRYVRSFAAIACGKLGRDEAVPELLLRFKEEYEPEGVVVNAAARSLLSFGSAGGLDRLVKNLRARQLEREGAIAVLAELVGDDFGFDPSGPELERRAAATKWEEWLAFDAARFLASRPPPPAPSDRLALRILATVDSLREFQMRTIDDARLVLERLSRVAVPYLRLGLRDESSKIRGYCVEVVTLLGARARDATPELTGLTRDELLAPFAFQALGSVAAPADAGPHLLRGLDDAGRLEVRIACAAGLGALGEPSIGREPLRKLLEGSGAIPADLEFTARVALGALGDFASFGRALDLAEEGGSIDPDVAVRSIEDALARATRSSGAPFRPAGAVSGGATSGSSAVRSDPSASGAESDSPPRAARAAAIKDYLESRTP